jgi:hypothetical protein
MILLYVKYLNDRQEYIESFINDENREAQRESRREEKQESNNDIYLYPTRDLQDECEKDGLKPAFMPTICQIGDTLNAYANCKCVDSNGKCKTCYPDIKQSMSNGNIIYDAYPNINSAITQTAQQIHDYSHNQVHIS